MKRYGTCVAVVFVMLCLLAGTASSVVAKAKPFETLSYENIEELLKGNRGKIVMINFFASWCPPCREEVPSLIQLRKEFREDELLLIGASLDESEKDLLAYMAKTPFNYPIKKAGQDLVYAAGVSGIPHMLAFDGKGEVILNQAGLIPENKLRNFLKAQME